MKVLITGAFSTGKTTTVRLLEQYLAAVAVPCIVLDDTARSCPFPLNQAQTRQATIWIGCEQVRKELEAQSSKNTVVLCDRGIPDLLSHCAHLKNASGGCSGGIKEFLTFCESWARTYDLVFLSRIDNRVQIAADGVRSESHAYRRDLELSLLEVLGVLKVVFHELPASPQDRVVAIAGAITSVARRI